MLVGRFDERLWNRAAFGLFHATPCSGFRTETAETIRCDRASNCAKARGENAADARMNLGACATPITLDGRRLKVGSDAW